MAQTPQQRRANEAFARNEANKRGKPQSDKVLTKKEKPQKAPINKMWLYVLLFVVCGGIVVEAIRIIAGFFS